MMRAQATASFLSDADGHQMPVGYCLGRRVFAGLLALLVLWPGWVIAGWSGSDPEATSEQALPRLTWCINHFPRWHEYPDGGEPHGPSVDFMRELAGRAGFELEISSNTPIARCLRMMELGQVDLMSNLNYSVERDRFMHLIPMVEDDPESFWLRCNSPFADDPNRHLEQMRLITLRGSSRKPNVARALNDLPRPILLTETWEKAFDMVLLGRADAVIAPTASAYTVVEAKRRFHRSFCPVLFEPEGADPNHIYLGISRKSGHQHFHQQIKSAIDGMRDDGSLARLFPRLGGELPDPP